MAEVNQMAYQQGGQNADDIAQGRSLMGKLGKILIIVVVLLLLIVGGVIAALFLLPSEEAAEETAAEPPKENVNISTDPSTIAEPFFLPIGTFIVNLADGRRYLKTTMELMLSEEAAMAYLQGRLAEVKDLVVAELQVLSTEQLRDPRERSNLQQRLLQSIESLFPNQDREWEDPAPIKKVLITEFYLQ